MATTTKTYTIRVRPNYCGAFDSTANYDFWDMVYDENSGCSYLCINTDGAAAGSDLTDSDYWAKTADTDARYTDLDERLSAIEDLGLSINDEGYVVQEVD